MADLPDWFAAAVLKGHDGSALQTIKCATTGELYILLSALYNSTIKPLKCDADGNAFLNVKAQDLAEVINRPKYGAANLLESNIVCSHGAWTSLGSVSGKGIIYGGFVSLSPTDSLDVDEVRLIIDGQSLGDRSMSSLIEKNYTSPWSGAWFITRYDTTNQEGSVSPSPGITFETSFEVKFVSQAAAGETPFVRIFYAVV